MLELYFGISGGLLWLEVPCRHLELSVVGDELNLCARDGGECLSADTFVEKDVGDSSAAATALCSCCLRFPSARALG
jgi:hypothetical protein